MGRLFALLVALVGAAALSQGPEFSQQYMQRLAGQVEALREYVVEPMENDAAAVGFSREQALQDLANSGEFASLHSRSLEGMLDEYDRLDDHMDRLRLANDYERTWLIAKERNVPLMRATAEDYQPALPLTVAGGAHAGAGFIIGWIIGALIAGIIGLIFSPFRRRQYA